MAYVIDPKPHPSVVKETICYTGCGARIGYTPKDIVREYSAKDISGVSDRYKVLQCPNCYKEIHLDA